MCQMQKVMRPDPHAAAGSEMVTTCRQRNLSYVFRRLLCLPVPTIAGLASAHGYGILTEMLEEVLCFAFVWLHQQHPIELIQTV